MTCLWVGSVQDRVFGSLFSLVQCFVSSHQFCEDINEHLYTFVEQNDASMDLVKQRIFF